MCSCFTKESKAQSNEDCLNGHIKQLPTSFARLFPNSVVLCYLLKLSSSSVNFSVLPVISIKPTLEGGVCLIHMIN